MCSWTNTCFRYIPLPSPLMPNEKLGGSPLYVRDITVIKGCIKYFEMCIQIKPSATRTTYISDGWEAATWKSMDSGKNWLDDCKLDVSEIRLDNLSYSELLPNLLDDEAKELTLSRLHAGLPALSLHLPDVVYIMTKVDRLDDKAWVLAVDMKKKTLQGVADFGPVRISGFRSTYIQSGISRHMGTVSSTRYKGTAAETSMDRIVIDVARMPTREMGLQVDVC